MPQPKLTDADILTTLEVYAKNGGDKYKTAVAIGKSVYTVDRHIEQAEVRGLQVISPDLEFPVFPDEDMPIETIIDYMQRQTDRAIEHQESLKWYEVKVKANDPIGIAWIGDPHLGVSCNWRLLRHDIDVIKATPGMYAAPMGDMADNWAGRLLRIWADKDISRKTERRLARWFLLDAKIPFIVFLLGNHDVMDHEFGNYLKTIHATQVPMVDWRAQFKIVFKNGRECRIDAAHDHKGHSKFNPLHAQGLIAASNEWAHIVVAGHRHNWAAMQVPLDNGATSCLMRARGYKWVDDYRVRHQFSHQEDGATVATIIDPNARSEAEFVTPFASLTRAADYLTFLRKKSG